MNWFKRTKLYYWLRCLIFGYKNTKHKDMEDYIQLNIDETDDVSILKKIAKAWQEKAYLAEVKLFLKTEKISDDEMMKFLNIEKAKELIKKVSS